MRYMTDEIPNDDVSMMSYLKQKDDGVDDMTHDIMHMCNNHCVSCVND